MPRPHSCLSRRRPLAKADLSRREADPPLPLIGGLENPPSVKSSSRSVVLKLSAPICATCGFSLPIFSREDRKETQRKGGSTPPGRFPPLCILSFLWFLPWRSPRSLRESISSFSLQPLTFSLFYLCANLRFLSSQQLSISATQNLVPFMLFAVPSPNSSSGP